MENRFLCLMAGYDDDTENRLAGIQSKLYAAGLTGEHTKNIPQHITLQLYPTGQEGLKLVLLSKTRIQDDKDCLEGHLGSTGRQLTTPPPRPGACIHSGPQLPGPHKDMRAFLI